MVLIFFKKKNNTKPMQKISVMRYSKMTVLQYRGQSTGTLENILDRDTSTF